MEKKRNRKGNPIIERMIDYIMENGVTIRRLKVMISIVLFIAGVSKKIIPKILGITPKTVKKYIKYYENDEVEKALEYETYKRKSELENYNEEIERELTERPCKTLKEIQQKIYQITNQKRGITQIWNYVRKLGFKPLQIGNIPSKANIEEQRNYINNELKPLLEKAKAGLVKVFFVDSSHFVMGAGFGKIWTKARMYIKSSSGRQRYNVLGALDFVTKKITAITNETYITSTQVVELIDKLIEENMGSIIYLVMDNARYQRCKLVIEHAESRGVKLKFIPPYSPNLNLIERFWKYVKKEALAVNYFVTFKDYKEKIDLILNEADKSRKGDLDSLITENFKLYDKNDFLQLVS